MTTKKLKKMLSVIRAGKSLEKSGFTTIEIAMFSAWCKDKSGEVGKEIINQ